MAVPNSRNARRQPGVGGSGSAGLKSKQLDNELLPAAQLLLSDLETVAAWRDDLNCKLRRAELIFELVDVDGVDIDALADEVEAFRQVCRALIECVPGSLIPDAANDLSPDHDDR